VYFDVPGGDVDNNFQIIRSEHFQYSPLTTDSKMHICLDNVYYPLEYDKVGLSNPIYFPIALRFGLTDGLFPTPNRESIRYTKEAKAIIMEKIKQVSEYMVLKYNESIFETENIIEIMNYYSNDRRNLDFNDNVYDISGLEQFSTTGIAHPKLKGINIIDLKTLHRNKDYILNEYQVRFKIDQGKFRECKRHWDSVIRIGDMTKDRHFIYDDKLSGKKKDYLRELMGKNSGYGNNKFLIKKVKSYKLGNINKPSDYETYMDIIGLRKIQRHLWRAAIKEFQSIVAMYVGSLPKIEDIEVPQDWIDSKKKAKITISGGTIGPKVRRIKLKGEIVGKEASPLERYVDGKNCKWVPTTYKLEDAHKKSYLIVYGSQVEADIKTMDNLFDISIGLKRKIKFVSFSERELKNLEKLELHNWIKLDKFMEGNNKPFKRLITAYLINELMSANSDTFSKKERIKCISEDFVNKLEILENFREANYKHSNDAIYKAMLTVAQENNLFDGEIYPIYKEVKAFLNRYGFVETLLDKSSYYSGSSSWDKDPMVSIIRDMLKYHRRRIDWKNYNVKLNEEVVVELTEDVIDELQD
jgi:hypothetical protein